MPIRILLADDSEIVRRVIRQQLEQQPGFEIVGEAVDFAQTVRMANDLNPEIIVMDLYMPEMTSLGSPPHLDVGKARIIGMSIFNDNEATELATSLGAAVLLDKANLYDELFPTIMQMVSPRP